MVHSSISVTIQNYAQFHINFFSLWPVLSLLTLLTLPPELYTYICGYMFMIYVCLCMICLFWSSSQFWRYIFFKTTSTMYKSVSLGANTVCPVHLLVFECTLWKWQNHWLILFLVQSFIPLTNAIIRLNYSYMITQNRNNKSHMIFITVCFFYQNLKIKTLRVCDKYGALISFLAVWFWANFKMQDPSAYHSSVTRVNRIHPLGAQTTEMGYVLLLISTEAKKHHHAIFTCVYFFSLFSCVSMRDSVQ
jgi:hypothetical protein